MLKVIYIICFLASTAFAWLASHSKNRITLFVCSAISILILCVLGGLRDSSIGTDVMVYVYPDYSVARSSSSLLEFLARIPYRETAYLLIIYISCKIFGHPNWALFFFQLITISCFYIGAYRHRKTISLPFFMLIFCLMRYNQTYNMMRQLIAISIIFMGITEMENRQYYKFSMYILVAYLFHTSALINFPLLLAFHMMSTSETVAHKVWLKFLIAIGIVLFLVAFRPVVYLLLDIIPNTGKYKYYLSATSKYNVTDASGSMISIMSVELLVLALYRKHAEKIILPIEHGGGFTFCQFMLIFCTVYQIAVKFFSDRILAYLYSVNLLLLAELPRFIKNKNIRFILSAGIIFTMAFYWWFTYVLKGFSETYPYKSIL